MSDNVNGMILRTVYLTPQMDSLLRTRAFRMDISKNELIRNYLQKAMDDDTESLQVEAQQAVRAAEGIARLYAQKAKKTREENRKKTGENQD